MSPYVKVRRNPPLALRRTIAWRVARRTAMAVIGHSQVWRR